MGWVRGLVVGVVRGIIREVIIGSEGGNTLMLGVV